MNDDRTAKIQHRAYLLWERENRPEGMHLEHWLCAEAEINAEQSPVIAQSNSTIAETSGEPEVANRARRGSV